MAENVTIRLNKVLRELNISLDRAVEYLAMKGHTIEARPTTKISNEIYQVLQNEFQTDMSKKVASKEVGEKKREEKEAIRIQLEQEQEDKRLARERRASASELIKARAELSGPKTVGKIDLDGPKKKAAPKEVKVEEKVEIAAEPKTLTTQYKKLSGPKIMGDKIDLAKFAKPKKKKEEPKAAESADKKKRRRRITSNTGKPGSGGGARGGNRGRTGGQRFTPKVEPSEEDVQKQVRETLEKLQGKSKKGKGAKYRRDKRDQHRLQSEADIGGYNDGCFYNRDYLSLYVFRYYGYYEPAP